MTPQMFWTMWLLSLAWALLVIAASVILRRRRGRYLLRPEFPDAIYAERWRSGRSLRSVVTRLGGASGCLSVTVTPEALHIGPHFPFNLMFLPEIYRLEHRIAVADVLGVDVRRSFFGGRRVAVRVARPGGTEETVELHLADPERFIAALATVTARIQ